MSGADPVSWDELGRYCSGKQAACHELHEARAQNHALEIEHERRKGYSELQGSINALAGEVAALKELWSSKAAWFLPKPVIYMLMFGGVGIGLAGRDLVAAVLKYLGVG